MSFRLELSSFLQHQATERGPDGRAGLLFIPAWGCQTHEGRRGAEREGRFASQVDVRIATTFRAHPASPAATKITLSLPSTERCRSRQPVMSVRQFHSLFAPGIVSHRCMRPASKNPLCAGLRGGRSQETAGVLGGRTDRYTSACPHEGRQHGNKNLTTRSEKQATMTRNTTDGLS